MLNRLKIALLKPGEHFFERDLRHDSSLNLVTMHTFITSQIYLELIYDYASLECYIAYDFEYCTIEQQVRAILNQYPLSEACVHEPRPSGVKAYLQAVIAFQGDNYSFAI